MDEKTLKINTSEQVNVIDVFVNAKKWVEKKIISFTSYATSSTTNVVTLKWAPLLARAPDFDIRSLSTSTTTQYLGSFLFL